MASGTQSQCLPCSQITSGRSPATGVVVFTAGPALPRHRHSPREPGLAGEKTNVDVEAARDSPAAATPVGSAVTCGSPDHDAVTGFFRRDRAVDAVAPGPKATEPFCEKS